MNDLDPSNPRPVPFMPDPIAADVRTPAKPRPFALWGPEDFAKHETPPGLDILGEAILRRGNLALLMGQPGLGKSTMAFALAVADLRRDSSFCGIPLHRPAGPARRWLFIGTENGVERWKRDLADASKAMPEDRREDFNAGLRVAALFLDDEGDITLPDREGRILETVREANPAVVVVDPWTELCPDEVKSDAVRACIASLRRAVRQAARDAAILLVIHAKAGRELVAEGMGNFGSTNMQRGNRLVTNAARSALLVVPHDDDGQDLVVALAKCNDGPPLDPRRVSWDREAFRYRVVDGFDLDAWRDGLREKTKANRKVTPEDVAAVVAAGVRETKGIVDRLAGKAGKRSVMDALADALRSGLLEKTGRGLYNLGPNYRRP